MIEFVSGTQIRVASLTGLGFSPNDVYRIRSNSGQSTNVTPDANLLQDNNADFIAMNVLPGQIVRNLTDGSNGVVTIITNTTLTVDSLRGGTTNVFSANNNYNISRYNHVENITTGLLPVYEPGEGFTSDFDVDWSMTAANGNTIIPTSFTGENSIYANSIQTWIQESENNAGTISVADNNSACNWIEQLIIDCRGKYEDTELEFMQGVITSSTSTTMTDTNMNFPNIGVKRGDKVKNTTNLTQGIVSGTSGSNSLTISNISGSSALTKSAGQPYQVEVATSFTTGTATLPTAQLVYRLYDSSGKLSAADVDDVIENTNFNAIGIVTNVDPNGLYVDFTELQGGAGPDFILGDGYRIYHNYVAKREYSFDLKLSGTAVMGGNGIQRSRTICTGYDSNCTIPSPIAVRGDDSTAVIALRDYDDKDTLVGEVFITIPSSGTAQSSIRISNMLHDFKFIEANNELPKWFLNNRWHEYTYVSYSSGFASGGAGSCTAGADCLTLNVQKPAGIETWNDREAVVLVAGRQLAGQDRSIGILASYFENNNASGTLLFDKNGIDDFFNDQISVVAP